MTGNYFILTEYESGRIGVSERRYKTERQAERRAERRRQQEGIKTAKVKYTTGQTVDIKKFI